MKLIYLNYTLCELAYQTISKSSCFTRENVEELSLSLQIQSN